MVKTVDQRATQHSGVKHQEETGSASAERLARAVIEQHCGRRLTDKEWAKQRRRLIEFVLTLARWDLEQRRSEAQNIDSALQSSRQSGEDTEACITSDPAE